MRARFGIVLLGAVAQVLFAAGVFAADGVTAESITLGQTCALTGPSAQLGRGMRDGLLACFNKVKVDGGIKGRQINLVTADDVGLKAKAAANSKNLIEEQHVFGLIGSVTTPTSIEASEVCVQAKVPFIAPLSGTDRLRQAYVPEICHMRASYEKENEAIVRYFVDKKGFSKVACFCYSDGAAVLNGINKAMEKRGKKVFLAKSVERGTLAMADALTEIAKANPEAVVLYVDARQAATFIKAARNHPRLKNTLFCSISYVDTVVFQRELGGAGDGVIIAQVVPYPWDESVPVVKEYLLAMRQSGFEDEIGWVSLEGFLAAKLFCRVLEKIEGTPSRAAFCQTLAGMGDLDLGGFRLHYGPDDNQGSDDVFLTVLRKDGRTEQLRD